MRALSLRSVTAVLEAPLRNGGQLMDWAYVLLHRPDDCGVAMNSNFFPSYHPKMRSLASWAARTPGKRRDATTRTRRCRDATGSCWCSGGERFMAMPGRTRSRAGYVPPLGTRRLSCERKRSLPTSDRALF